jgi:hypothetical protein
MRSRRKYLPKAAGMNGADVFSVAILLDYTPGERHLGRMTSRVITRIGGNVRGQRTAETADVERDRSPLAKEREQV